MTAEELRPLMLSIAYRMVGSYSEAEDIVQEAYMRLQQAEEEVFAPKAYLSTITTRLSIDHLRSARVRREQYTGTWLPEPVFADPAPDAAARAETADTISLALLVVLETLSPVERAVFLLREVFAYGYDEIAAIVDRSEANCRQLFVRARRHVEERRPRFDPPREQRDELARRFLAAVEEGETEALVSLLAEDVAFYGDGGGKAPAVGAPIHGRERVVRLLLGFSRVGKRDHIRVEPVEVNGQPGLRAVGPDGELIAVMSFHVVGGAIATVHSIVNPDKLAHLRR